MLHLMATPYKVTLENGTLTIYQGSRAVFWGTGPELVTFYEDLQTCPEQAAACMVTGLLKGAAIFRTQGHRRGEQAASTQSRDEPVTAQVERIIRRTIRGDWHPQQLVYEIVACLKEADFMSTRAAPLLDTAPEGIPLTLKVLFARSDESLPYGVEGYFIEDEDNRELANAMSLYEDCIVAQYDLSTLISKANVLLSVRGEVPLRTALRRVLVGYQELKRGVRRKLVNELEEVLRGGGYVEGSD